MFDDACLTVDELTVLNILDKKKEISMYREIALRTACTSAS